MRNSRVILDETAVEVAKTKEGLHFFYFGWDRVLLDSFDFSWIHSNKSFGDDKAKIFNGGFGE